MNTIVNKQLTINELSIIAKSCFNNSTSIIDGPFVIIDINDRVKYTIWLKKPNVFEVIPQKAIWNRTFEMKAKAQEIANQIKEFVENGSSAVNPINEIPNTCPSC